MTQRIFDTDNKKDMVDLLDILPDDVVKITKRTYNDMSDLIWYNNDVTCESPFAINWHDRTEITRPIKEASEADVGKLCRFSNGLYDSKYYGVLIGLRETNAGTRYVAQSCNGTHPFVHAYRLNKQEIQELC